MSKISPIDSLDVYLKDVNKHPLLSAEAQVALAKEYRRLTLEFREKILSIPWVRERLTFIWQNRIENKLDTGRLTETYSIHAGNTKSSCEKVDSAFKKIVPLVQKRLKVAESTRKRIDSKIHKLIIEVNLSTDILHEVYKDLLEECLICNVPISHFDNIDSTWAQAEKLKEEFVARNLRLVFSVARKYMKIQNVDMKNDVIQEGNIGLMRAVEKFDPEKNIKFSTYAVWWIKQAIHRGLDKKGRLIKVPNHIILLQNKYRAIIEQFEKELERQPTDEELKSLLNINDDNLERVRYSLFQAQNTVDAPGLSDAFMIEDESINLDEQLLEMSMTKTVAKLLKRLDSRDKKIIKKRFGIGYDREYTLEEIGREMKISRERTRQLEKKALELLRTVRQSEVAEYF